MFSKSLIALTASLVFATSAFASARLAVMPNGLVAQPDGKKNAVKAGIVSSAGSIVGGTNFSVSHDATGQYTVDVPAGTFTGCPAIIVTPAGINGHLPIANDYNYLACGNGEVKMQVRMYARNNGAAEDNAFHFVMIET